MRTRATISGGLRNLPPRLALPQAAACDGVAHEFGALGEDPSSPKGIMTDLAVTHVLVAGHAHRRSMGPQGCHRIEPHHPVEGRRTCGLDRVSFIPWRDADAIQHDGHDRTNGGYKAGRFLQYHGFSRSVGLEMGYGSQRLEPTGPPRIPGAKREPHRSFTTGRARCRGAVAKQLGATLTAHGWSRIDRA
jgi:hypothetical protein